MNASLVLAAVLTMAAAGAYAQIQPSTSTSTPSGDVRRLTLAETIRLAEDADVALRSKRAELYGAQGALTEASSLLFNNPEASVDTVRRTVPQAAQPDGRWHEWHGGLSQTIEIAGQQGHRHAAAAATLDARRAEIEEARRSARSEAAMQFYRLVAQQERQRLDDHAMHLFELSASAVQKRKAAGEDTRLDANVAIVEAERARNQSAVSLEQLADAQADLAARLQLPPGVKVEADGQLSAPVASWTRQEVLAEAATLPRLRAFAAREDAAAERLKLEQAGVYPDVTVGVSVGREGSPDARERMTTVSMSVPLPLFKRNDAGIGQARTELEQVRAERQAATRDAQAQVAVLWAKLESLKARVDRLRVSVLPALQENEALSAKSQKAGQISPLELIVVNRQALDAQRDLIDAQLELQLTRLALEAASGWNDERSAQ